MARIGLTKCRQIGLVEIRQPRDCHGLTTKLWALIGLMVNNSKETNFLQSLDKVTSEISVGLDCVWLDILINGIKLFRLSLDRNMFKRRMKMVLTSTALEGALYIKGREKDGSVLDIYVVQWGRL